MPDLIFDRDEPVFWSNTAKIGGTVQQVRPRYWAARTDFVDGREGFGFANTRRAAVLRAVADQRKSDAARWLDLMNT